MATAAPTLTARPRPYRRFLTSAFHSRFVQASSVALLVAFDSAFWISDKRNLWSWFPIGPAILKIVLLFFTSLYIFILHVATLDVGRLNTSSPFMTLRSKVLSVSTPQILFWYILSAWWFSEIYIWTSPSAARLGWITKGEMSMPDRLNERPIYVRAILFCLALMQSLRHLYCDYSALHLPVSSPLPTPVKEQGAHSIDPVSVKMQKACIRILWQSMVTVVPTIVLGPPVYLFLRPYFWWIHLQFAKPFFNISRADARPTGYPPCNPFLIARTLLAEFLLVVTWEATTFLFGTYLLQEPLKKGQPLSTGSKDSNGTLVNGLKAKRVVVKTFAFWELAVIAQRFPERRKAIFADIERPDGVRWSQMLDLALEVIQNINARIAPPVSTDPGPATRDEPAVEIIPLPRIVSDVSTKPILTKAPRPRTAGKQVEAAIGNGLKWAGRSKEPWTPPVQKFMGILEFAKPPGADEGSNTGLTEQWWTFLKSSPVRWFFRSTPERRINGLVLGSPCGNAALIVDAIEGVTKMLVASLSEDVYGKAISGVPDAVRVFTKAISAIEELLQQNEKLRLTEMEEVLIVLQRLKDGLNELLAAFQLYLSDVGLGIGEFNDAKKASGKRHSEAMEGMTSRASENGTTGAEPRRKNLFGSGKQREVESASSNEAAQQEGKWKGNERTKVPSLFQARDGPSNDGNGMNRRPDRRREMEMVR